MVIVDDDSKRRAERERVLHKVGMRNIKKVTGKSADQIVGMLESVIKPSEDNVVKASETSEVGETERDILEILEDVSDAAQAYISEFLEDGGEIESLLDKDFEDCVGEDKANQITEDLSALLEDLAAVKAEDEIIDAKLDEVLSQIESEMGNMLTSSGFDQSSPEDEKNLKDYLKEVFVPRLIAQSVGEAIMVFSDQPLVGDVDSEEPIEDFSPETLTSPHQIPEKDADELINLLLL